MIVEFECKIVFFELMEWFFDIVSGLSFDVVVFGYAVKSFWRECYFDVLVGDGVFSDVFLIY